LPLVENERTRMAKAATKKKNKNPTNTSKWYIYIYIGNNWVLRWVAAHGCMIVWSSCGYTAPRSNLSKAAQSFYVLNAVFTFFNWPLQLGICSRAAEHWLGDASGSQNCACKRKHALCDTVRASPPLCSSKQVQILFLKTL
jgi:hypothetical protein